jgi:hypothetical protein
MIATRALLVLVALLIGASCAGLVVEPTDESVATGIQKFWGYTMSPGEQVRLEAQSTTWEQLSAGTSATAPTHTGGSSGYYFEISYNVGATAARFRKTSPYSGFWRANYRLTTAANGTLQTRQWTWNGRSVPGESWLARFWNEHSTSSSTIRLDVRL